jgi:hypothetical protein
MFWAVILLMVAIVIGASVGVGAFLSRPAHRARRRPDPHDPVTALKASGALKHRKSNRN